MSRSKVAFGVLFLLAGFAMICICGWLIYRNETENREAQQSVACDLPRLKEKIADETGNPDNTLYQRWLLGEAYAEPDSVDTDTSFVIPLDGYDYIGYLTFPTLGLELPVMDRWDMVRLKKAPCHYYGSAETGDLVIAAHNYRSSFGQLNHLNIGDEILFTNAAGIVYRYRVGEIEIVQPTAIDYMIHSDWELSLYTCTYGGKQRVTVRCEEIHEESELMPDSGISA